MNPNHSRNRETPLSPVEARRLAARNCLSRARESGGMTLLVDGMAGMGKTFLLRELIDAATEEERGNVSFLRADEIESSEPYSFIERLVAGSGLSDWDFVADPTASPVLVARECIRRLAAEPDAPLKVIIIDDAQWIDVESQRVLRYLIPRVTRRNILLAFGARSPHQPGTFGEFLVQLVRNSPTDAHHQVHPLTTPEISALTTERLNVGISTLTAQRMFDVTGGSFLSVDSMIAAISPEEITQLHFAWDTPIRAHTANNDFLLHPFLQLSEGAQRTCEIVCLAGHEVTREELATAGRILGEQVQLEEALRADVLNESGFGSTIMPRHALLSQAVSTTIPPERAREISRAVAGATSGYRSLRHTLLSTEEWNEELHERVDDFVLSATRKGNLTIAGDVLRAALAIASTREARTALIESLALVYLQAKSGYLLLDLLDEVEQLDPSVSHEVISLVVGAHRVGEGLPMQRVQALLVAQPESPEDRAIQAFFAFMVVILTMRSADLTGVPPLIGLAKSIVARSPAHADELTDPRFEWLVDREALLVLLDCYLMVQDQFTSEVARAADALPELTRRIDQLPDGPLKVDALVAVAGARLALGNLAEGRALAERGVELIEHANEPWAAGTARLIFADCLVLEGQLGDATDFMATTEEIAFAALDVETRSTWAALRAIIAATTGRPDAEVQVRRARSQPGTHWEGYAPDLVVLAECEFARAGGDDAGVLQASSGARVEQLSNTRHGFLTYRAHALINTGRLEEAASLVEQLATWRGTQWQEYWGTLDWLRARLAEAREDSRTAQWHYEAAVTNREFPLPLGLTLADYSRFLKNQGRSEEASILMASAIRALEDIGADAYLPKLRDSSPKPASKDLPTRNRDQLLSALTERERQIVEQIAKGRSNTQIAESLVVSVTTVRSHVSNVLRKLRLSSRGEVSRALREDGVSEL